MGFFDLFKKPITIQDELFGQLTYIKAKDPSKSYFIGSGVFATTKDEIEYYVYADVNGPSSLQREFYKTIESSYDSLVNMMIPVVDNEFKKRGDNHKVKDFNGDFKVMEMYIRSMDKKPYYWEIAFEVIPGDFDQMIVEFEDFRPVRVNLVE